MKRISNIFLALVLAVSTAALAQDAMNKTVSGHVISSSAFDLAIQTEAGTRLNLVLDSSTSKPAVLAAGDQVTVVYRTLDTGGFQAIQVLEGNAATEPAKAAGSTTRTVTNVGSPGTGGQTGDSHTSSVGTTGGYQAPAPPTRATKDDSSMASMDHSMADTQPMPRTTPDTMDHTAMANDSMSNDKMANDTMANDKMASKNTMANDASLPKTASREPAVFVFGLLALGAAALLMRQRTTH